MDMAKTHFDPGASFDREPPKTPLLQWRTNMCVLTHALLNVLSNDIPTTPEARAMHHDALKPLTEIFTELECVYLDYKTEDVEPLEAQLKRHLGDIE
jgi:hypothetical protein